ncbi:MAG: hypothetical protein K2L86_15225 [Lachnospiraceae bacterium]|nr:hypothetical protein [Lachnospiraceae bacterium]
MRKEYDDIKKVFLENDSNVIINASRKQETIQYICTRNTDIKNAAGTRWQLVIGQLRYMNKSIFWGHLAACIGMVVFVWANWYDIQSWEKYGMIFSGALGALSVLEVGSTFFSRMTELEASCYFNVRQLTAFQMTYSGVLSLAALLLSTIFATIRLEKNILVTGMYILVPFVSTECVCLAVMLTEIGRRNILALTAASIFSAFLWSILASMPILYEASAMVFWFAALLVGAGIFTIQINWFFKILDKGEIICAD